MSTMRDYRRTDLRTNVLENPYWITSGEMDKDIDDKAAVLFSFPITGIVAPGYGSSVILVHEVMLEVNTAFIAATVAATIGTGTISADDAVNGDTVTDVTVDNYWEATDGAADFISIANHFPVAGSAWVTAKIAGVYGAAYIIVAADTNVPVVATYLTSNNPISAGSAYFHMLISRVPVVS